MKDYVTLEHFDASIAGLDQKFVTLVHFDATIDRLETRMDGFVTKDEFHSRMDEVVTILRRLDQERLFTFEWIKRIESDVSLVKKHLKLA